MIFPDKIYYEPQIFDFELGHQLKDKYSNIPWLEIDNHNNIPELRANKNSEFTKMKKHLVIGIRKTHRYIPNHKVSDFLVPYTSSGCSASCLYCYLVCNYNKCSYLRLFVNREQMLSGIIKRAKESEKDLCFEIGSNSDLVLENNITGNLPWTIENFAKEERGMLTFPTKFDMIDPLLSLEHKKRVIFRMSVNPDYIIRKIEFGTSSLYKRITALNRMCDAGYPVGILIAPIVLIENWRGLYTELIDILANQLSEKIKHSGFIEIIFMTYSFVHRAINAEAFPNAIKLHNETLMTGRGRGKYNYRDNVRAEGENLLKSELAKKLPEMRILYIS